MVVIAFIFLKANKRIQVKFGCKTSKTTDTPKYNTID